MKKISLFCLILFCIINSFGQVITPTTKIIDQISSKDTIGSITVEEFIIKETQGGKLDFNKFLENEKSTLFLYNGIAYNKNNFAILLWGRKVNLLGISSSKKAIKIWEEINKKEMSKSEKTALQKGFEIKT